MHVWLMLTCAGVNCDELRAPVRFSSKSDTHHPCKLLDRWILGWSKTILRHIDYILAKKKVLLIILGECVNCYSTEFRVLYRLAVVHCPRC
jgi:hypothetical protein